jgi:hypothetical protein
MKYVCLKNFFNYNFYNGQMAHYKKDEVYLIKENDLITYKYEPDDKYIIYDLNMNEMSRIGEDLFINFNTLADVRQERMDSIFNDE